MHERQARGLALGIGAMVVGAAFAFALRGGDRAPPAAAIAPTPSAGDAHGATLFVEQGCAECHSFRGIGNPSGALDDAASRTDPRELERWITAAPEVADALPRKARDAKARYAALPREDLDALVEWLRRPP
jgi:mono/diheme cytochrome c family protein